MAVFHVGDPGDPRLADYGNVPDPILLQHRRLFVAEGRLVVRRLLRDPRWVARSLMVTRSALDAVADVIGETPTFVVPQAVMNTITGFNLHRGCLAIGERPVPGDWGTLAAGARRLVILERVANADNIGAAFRNAAALHADGVLLAPGCTDPLYRKAIRTSMAAVFAMPFAPIEPWPDAVQALRAGGFHVVGLSPGAAPPLREVAARLGGGRIAVLAGHEGEGVTPAALAACDTLARIPMTGRVDSLNVATAIGIALYELAAAGGDAGADGLAPAPCR